jgi:hypothetical protein
MSQVHIHMQEGGKDERTTEFADPAYLKSRASKLLV